MLAGCRVSVGGCAACFGPTVLQSSRGGGILLAVLPAGVVRAGRGALFFVGRADVCFVGRGVRNIF